MKVGIVTWNTYTNYGTALQNVALQFILKKYAADVRTISDKEIFSSDKETFSERIDPQSFSAKFLKKISYLRLTKISDSYKKLRFRAKRNILNIKYKQFYNSFINIDHRRLEDIYDEYDIVVCGSDQIWAPHGSSGNEYYSHYFLGKFKGKKIAYAPSIGALEQNERVVSIITPWLKEFSAISCREASGARFLSRLLHHDIKAVLDPTLLVDRDEWISMFNINKSLDSDQYVLCYFLTYNKTYLKIAKQYASNRKLKLKVIVPKWPFVDNGYECVYPSPQEFLGLIFNARKIFTDSFHASIFSIIFNKDFITFKRYADNSTNNQNERIRNLFEWLDLSDHFVDENKYNVSADNCEIDYQVVENRVRERRETSKQFLENNIS